ncbi:MAG: hypothetical protein DRQ61_09915 [Gammaproteobacteria bacterium]|nr:MAG: hypothetical protein DRQ61_09915 [Gammaproteobacteria bacterium]
MKKEILLAALLFLSNGALWAEERLEIVAFDDEVVEVRKNGKVIEMKASDIGPLPIAILSKDKVNFLKIKGKDGGELWVSGSYVTTSNLSKIPKNCRSTVISKANDEVMYGVRGAGEKCKK